MDNQFETGVMIMNARELELNRARVAKHRVTKKEKGMVRIEIWVKQEDKAKLLEFAKSL